MVSDFRSVNRNGDFKFAENMKRQFEIADSWFSDQFLDSRNGDVPFTQANISFARREFVYKPTTEINPRLCELLWFCKEEQSVKKAIDSFSIEVNSFSQILDFD
ncbi:hypothetical protein LXL04_020035 [Taraxacum kok-saghyz]